jgi:lysylphosphatidylglycerol synthetase-like protein (DUF2156 family)
MTVPIPMSRRAAAERLARILLMAMLIPLIPLAVLLFWLLGLTGHQHHVVFAAIVTLCYLVFAAGSALVLYRVKMKQARKLDQLT